ncbi:MAG: hypothetical protein HC902_05795 [Calothrix sp. SM1_5_4]|nr:hypothetical protein [Calothrix sp. SM1_5_4]
MEVAMKNGTGGRHEQDRLATMEALVENAPINMMCADLNGIITYMNPQSTKTLKTIERDLPIRVDQIVGSSYDLFHKAPQKQRAMLADERNLPHRAVIQVGPHKLSLLASPMRDGQGRYLGPMVTWEVITDKVELTQALSETSQQLSAAAEELTATARQMSENSDKTSKQSLGAAASADQVSKGVHTVAINTEEMAASIKELARSSAEAARMSKESLQQAQETNEIIRKLGISSQEIGDVIKVINSIAQQTNLLALNATIEAARAGDAGKGFAVVANEVKELAKQTAKATEEITRKITAIRGDSDNAVNSIGGIAKTISGLNGISVTIAAAVEEQNATTTEVSRVIAESSQGVNDIATSIKTVAQDAQQNANGAKQTEVAAADLSALAVRLRQLMEKIKV